MSLSFSNLQKVLAKESNTGTLSIVWSIIDSSESLILSLVIMLC